MQGLDWFALARPFIAMAIMLSAMWEPKPRKPRRRRRRDDRTEYESLPRLTGPDGPVNRPAPACGAKERN